jgi:hypothetical protein
LDFDPDISNPQTMDLRRRFAATLAGPDYGCGLLDCTDPYYTPTRWLSQFLRTHLLTDGAPDFVLHVCDHKDSRGLRRRVLYLLNLYGISRDHDTAVLAPGDIAPCRVFVGCEDCVPAATDPTASAENYEHTDLWIVSGPPLQPTDQLAVAPSKVPRYPAWFMRLCTTRESAWTRLQTDCVTEWPVPPPPGLDPNPMYSHCLRGFTVGLCQL